MRLTVWVVLAAALLAGAPWAAAETNADRCKALIEEGDKLLDTQKYDEAIAKYKLAAKADPTNFEAVDSIGITYERQQKWPEALTAYKVAATVDPKEEGGWKQIISSALQTKDYSEATRAADKLAGLDPTSGFPPYVNGQVALANGKTEEAMDDFAKSLASDCRGPKTRMMAAAAALEAGKKDRAIGFLKDWVENVPSAMEALKKDNRFAALLDDPAFKAFHPAPAVTAVKEGDHLPEFIAARLETGGGNFTSGSLRDKAVLINVWAPT